jgi:hypothetical protein
MRVTISRMRPNVLVSPGWSVNQSSTAVRMFADEFAQNASFPPFSRGHMAAASSWATETTFGSFRSRRSSGL